MAKYITPNRLKMLNESIDYLQTITDSTIVVGESLAEIDADKTALLQEIARLNARRFDFMRQLEATETRYECPVCERKVTTVPDTICSNCYSAGASAMAKRF